MKRLRIAVVGAGVAGLACARALAARAEVTLFDKGRAPGGRLMTRRTPPHAFDLGAQYFTARDPRFAREVDAWVGAGVCVPWPATIVSAPGPGELAPSLERATLRYVAQPGMSALARHLAAGLTLHTSHRVERLSRSGPELRVHASVGAPGVTLGPSTSGASSEVDRGAYDRVAVCLPSAQAAPLVAQLSPALAARAAAVAMLPCIAVGWAPDDPTALRALPFDAAFIGREGAARAAPLAWVARDSSKPGRAPGERWVLHATPEWSAAHFTSPDAALARALVDAFAVHFGRAELSPGFTTVQRWAMARAAAPLGAGAFCDLAAGIGLCGDWASSGRVEGAFLSGLELAARLCAE